MVLQGMAIGDFGIVRKRIEFTQKYSLPRKQRHFLCLSVISKVNESRVPHFATCCTHGVMSV